MATYLHPGVYVEEISSGSKPIEGVATSVTAFVGETNRGTEDEAFLINSWDDYVSEYGEIADANDEMGLAVQAYYLNGGKTAYICRLIASGTGVNASNSVNDEATGAVSVLTISATSPGTWGNDIYFTISKDSSTSLSFDLEVGHREDGEFVVDETFKDLTMNDQDANYVLTQVNDVSSYVEISLPPASDPDDVTNDYVAGSLVGEAVGSGNTYFTGEISGTESMTVNINGLGAKQISIDFTSVIAGVSNETDGDAVAAAIQTAVRALGAQTAYTSFTCVYDDTTFQFTLTSGAAGPSSSVDVYAGDLAEALGLDPDENTRTENHGTAPVIPDDTSEFGVSLGSGTTGAAGSPADGDYSSFFSSKLVKVRDVTVIVLPGESWASDGSGNTKISHAIAHCEATKSRVTIVDVPTSYELSQATKVTPMGLPTSTYSVLYYPWVKVSNPFYNADTNPDVSTTLTIAPSAFAAGMWSKIDGKRGVWKAPAGVETNLLGVAGLEYNVEDGEQDQLNPLGVNCIRKLPNYGSVIWGTRTLSTKADPEWRYVPVRRTAIFIEQSIYNGIQWAVFEPNTHNLWSSLRANIDSFMNGLFRAGAFQGEKASDAYFVRCGLGDTMTQGDIDAGQVIVLVGFAPAKPAEFVIVRIQQKVSQQ